MPFATLARLVAVLPLAVACASCGLLGPSCLERQQGGAVTVVRGEVAAGSLTWHLLPYDTAGSQNTITVAWPGAGAAGGPRLQFHVTRAACERFAPGASVDDPCAVLAEAGQRQGGPFASTLTVTHGRGNPLVLGRPAEYRVWVVGDTDVSSSYTLDARWSYGPDC